MKHMKSSMNYIGCNLRKLRKKFDLSIFTVATELQMSAHYLGTIERAKANPSIKMLDRLADYYHVSTKSLFEGWQAITGKKGRFGWSAPLKIYLYGCLPVPIYTSFLSRLIGFASRWNVIQWQGHCKSISYCSLHPL